MPQENPDSPRSDRPLVFFDGVCHLCNGFVDFVLRHDSSLRIQFAPLQGETAARFLGPDQRQALSTVFVRSGDVLLEKSDAILKVLGELPRWRWTRVFRAVPRPLRDLIYDLVARRRYAWFGERETCRLPTPAERSRLFP